MPEQCPHNFSVHIIISHSCGSSFSSSIPMLQRLTSGHYPSCFPISIKPFVIFYLPLNLVNAGRCNRWSLSMLVVGSLNNLQFGDGKN